MRGRYADYSQHLYERPEVHIHVTDGRSLHAFDAATIRRGADDAGGHLGFDCRGRFRAQRKQSLYRGSLPRIFRSSQARWHDRDHALGIPPSARSVARGFGRDGGAASASVWRIRRATFIVASQGRSMKTESRGGAGQENAFHRRGRSGRAGHFDAIPRTQPALPAVRDPLATESVCRSDREQRSLSASRETYAYNVAPVSDNAPFFFFTLKAGQVLGEQGLRRRHRLEGKSRSAGLAAGAGDFARRGAGVSDSAARAARRKPAVAASAALFCRGRPGLHSGGDCFHPALRSVSRTSDLCADGGDFPADALERRRQPVFAPLASAARNGLDAACAGGRSPCWRMRSSFPAALAAWVGLAFGYRLLVSGVLLVPLGFVMGMPFPTGLRALAATPGARRTCGRRADARTTPWSGHGR